MCVGGTYRCVKDLSPRKVNLDSAQMSLFSMKLEGWELTQPPLGIPGRPPSLISLHHARIPAHGPQTGFHSKSGDIKPVATGYPGRMV